jgi:hypothetical protein
MFTLSSLTTDVFVKARPFYAKLTPGTREEKKEGRKKAAEKLLRLLVFRKQDALSVQLSNLIWRIA